MPILFAQDFFLVSTFKETVLLLLIDAFDQWAGRQHQR
jgi:hypothetical protein